MPDFTLQQENSSLSSYDLNEKTKVFGDLLAIPLHLSTASCIESATIKVRTLGLEWGLDKKPPELVASRTPQPQSPCGRILEPAGTVLVLEIAHATNPS